MNKKMKLTIILTTFIILSDSSYALSFGSYVKNSETNINRGGRGSFDIIFFSRDNNIVKFELNVGDYPNGFTVTYPENFELNSNSYDEDYILIENEYVKTKKIRVNIDVSTDTDLGEYRILLKVHSVSGSEQQNSLGVNSEKTFLLKVNVIDEVSNIKQTLKTEDGINIEATKSGENLGNESTINTKEFENKIVEGGENISSTGAFTAVNDKTPFWIVCIISIVIISYLIYKKNVGTKDGNYVENQN